MLVVEDDPIIRQVCADLTISLGHHIKLVDSVPAARSLLQTTSVDLVLLDLHLPGGNGVELLEHLRSTQPYTSVVIMTAHATVGSAVDLMRDGACDFLHKPFSLDRLVAVIDAAQERRRWSSASRALRERLVAGTGMGKLIGASPGMQKVFRLISKVALTRHPVLIVGESGTGKEAVARTIHANGPNASSAFVPVDCTPAAPEFLDAELFGNPERSALAARATPGVLVTAGHGTVFLDEIGSLPLPLQAKLMRALEEKRVRSGGTTAGVPFEARILAASSKDLHAMVEAGRFRKDLYYRLNVVKVELPQLRERPGDVLLLTDHFLKRQNREHGIVFTLTDEASHFLQDYFWAGNVRELECTIERACSLSSSPLIHLENMQTQVQAYALVTRSSSEDLPTMQAVERETILNTLQKLKGDKLLAAKVLGIGKTTLYRKLKEYGLGDDLP